MNNDRKIAIAIAETRLTNRWPSKEMLWSEFVKKCELPIRTEETLADYLKSNKSVQDDLKDVGGFVGGTFRNGIRNKRNVLSRDLVTLDFDSIPAGGTLDVLAAVDALGVAYTVYSTRKHQESAPRLRIVLPSDRTMSPDEYEPVARKIAEKIGMSYADPTTFDISRLFYWPSCSSDSEYIYTNGDNSFFSVDAILGMYSNWKDVRVWPTGPTEETIHANQLAKQQDPTTKTGVIGAFCKQYDVPSAIKNFLPGVYIPVDDHRYTYAKGSTAGGAVLYGDGNFLYSHHATDPISGQLVNSFDLVRLHKFSDLDINAKPRTATHLLPSYKEMKKFAAEDEGVKGAVKDEMLQKAKDVFTAEEIQPAENQEDWLKDLAITQNGKCASTIQNVTVILQNAPEFKNKIAYDAFSNRGLLLGPVPWDKENKERRLWQDFDDAGLRRYLEDVYGISAREKISDGILIVSKQHEIHDVKNYLDTLIWDGEKRLESLFIDYLGAEDNEYIRAVTKKSFTAGVARIYIPGVKYDYMPILTGPQGIGKSSLLAIMAGEEWFSDSLQTFSGKEAAEMLQGVWINEIAELNAMRFSEVTAVKQFLSKRDDVYREAYGRHTSRFQRQCIFFGTSNESTFLRDRTGNRRFWPVETGVNKPTASVWNDLPKVRDQLWAEAKAYFQLGERLFLEGDIEKIALQKQEDHREVSAKEGLVAAFLDKPVPEDWDVRTLSQRRMFLQGNTIEPNKEFILRDKICAAEIWCELFNSDLKYMKRTDTIEINRILENAPGWRRNRGTRSYGEYGKQRGFERIVPAKVMNINTELMNNYAGTK